MLKDIQRLEQDGGRRLSKGMYVSSFPFNGHLVLFSGQLSGRGGSLSWEERKKRDYPKFEGTDLYAYGVVDTPDQFAKKFGQLLETDQRNLTVMFTHVEKDPDNRGQGGGWRWHKWGPYFGDGRPEHEYLDDETGFENGVWVFHIYETSTVGNTSESE